MTKYNAFDGKKHSIIRTVFSSERQSLYALSVATRRQNRRKEPSYSSLLCKFYLKFLNLSLNLRSLVDLFKKFKLCVTFGVLVDVTIFLAALCARDTFSGVEEPLLSQLFQSPVFLQHQNCRRDVLFQQRPFRHRDPVALETEQKQKIKRMLSGDIVLCIHIM